LGLVSKSSISPSWLDDSPSNYVLEAYFLPNAQALPQVTGVFLNTFDWFEPETIAALNGGRVSYVGNWTWLAAVRCCKLMRGCVCRVCDCVPDL
ncbi:hypothetical protein HAX54_049320, partial [Datura stramonium]|nr:hypothetical protein [Datura stramonium]